MKLKLSPPWVTFAKEVKALFAGDKDVHVLFDQEEMTIRLYVQGAEKAEALMEILPVEKDFGSVSVKLEVIPANDTSNIPIQDVYRSAFSGNPNFAGVKHVQIPMFGEFTYLLWRCAPVQFFNDNLADAYGNQTMLIADVARDVLPDIVGVYQCSELLAGLNAPLGEWP